MCIKLLMISIILQARGSGVCSGSAVEVSANSSEIQIRATELSFFSTWLIPTIWKIPPPNPRRGSDLSEADGAGVARGLKMATNSFTILPLKGESSPLSESELACGCPDKWSRWKRGCAYS